MALSLTYDVTSDPHPLLSQTVQRMADVPKAALNGVAERVLGLTGRTYTLASDVDTATLAVVYQMNYLAEIDDQAWGLHSERRGQRQVQYRTARGQVMPRVAPLARELMGQLSDAGWGDGIASARSGG